MKNLQLFKFIKNCNECCLSQVHLSEMKENRNFAGHKMPQFTFKLLILCYNSLHAIDFSIVSPQNPMCSKFSNLLLLRPAESNLHLNIFAFSRCYQNFSKEFTEIYLTQYH